jgi:hypothetical protein
MMTVMDVSRECAAVLPKMFRNAIIFAPVCMQHIWKIRSTYDSAKFPMAMGNLKPWALQCSLIVRSICDEDTVKESVERAGFIFTATRCQIGKGRLVP